MLLSTLVSFFLSEDFLLLQPHAFFLLFVASLRLNSKKNDFVYFISFFTYSLMKLSFIYSFKNSFFLSFLLSFFLSFFSFLLSFSHFTASYYLAFIFQLFSFLINVLLLILYLFLRLHILLIKLSFTHSFIYSFCLSFFFFSSFIYSWSPSVSTLFYLFFISLLFSSFLFSHRGNFLIQLPSFI